MDDLISRATAITALEEYLQELDLCISEPDLKLDGYRNGLEVAIYELKKAPTVDAIPVEWLRNLCTIAKMETEDKIFIDWLIQMWQEEQEER